VVCDLDELCELLNNSWPPRQQDSITTESDGTLEKPGGSEEGEIIDDQANPAGQYYDTRLMVMPYTLQTSELLCEPGCIATTGDNQMGRDIEPLGDVQYQCYAQASEPRALLEVVDSLIPSNDGAHLGHDEPATARIEGESETEVHFGDEAMRVLETCEVLLNGTDGEGVDRDRVLHEIGLLKKRYRHNLATGSRQASRCLIMRRSRRQERRHTLGMEARRLLKEWVDAHLEEPYPTIVEKQELASATCLSLKQINDWFTNYRKRHWDESMLRNRQRVFQYTQCSSLLPSKILA